MSCRKWSACPAPHKPYQFQHRALGQDGCGKIFLCHNPPVQFRRDQFRYDFECIQQHAERCPPGYLSGFAVYSYDRSIWCCFHATHYTAFFHEKNLTSIAGPYRPVTTNLESPARAYGTTEVMGTAIQSAYAAATAARQPFATSSQNGPHSPLSRPSPTSLPDEYPRRPAATTHGFHRTLPPSGQRRCGHGPRGWNHH